MIRAISLENARLVEAVVAPGAQNALACGGEPLIAALAAAQVPESHGRAPRAGQSRQELEDFPSRVSCELQEPLRKGVALGDNLKNELSEALGNKGNDFVGRTVASAARTSELVQGLVQQSREEKTLTSSPLRPAMPLATALRVLLVEDNPGDVDLVREAVGDAFVLDSVGRIAELIGWVGRFGKPDLILLDLTLPDAHDLTGLDQARALAGDVPVIVLTGSSEALLGMQSVRLGAEDYLTKQEMSRSSLLRAINYAVERHRGRQHEKQLIAERVARVEAERAGQALRISEERLAAIIRTVMDAIITVDEDQRVVLFNTAAETMFRYAAADVVGGPLERLIPERFREAQRAHIRAFGAMDVTSRSMHSMPMLFARRSDGGEFPCEATLSQATAGRRKFYTVVLRDISERVRAEELRRLSVRLLDLRDQERKRVAGQLHENIAQSLSTLGLLLSSSPIPALAQNDEMRRFLGQTRALLRQCSADVQSIAYVLYPLALDNLGLAAAIRSYARDFTERHGIEVSLAIAPELEKLPSEHELAFFRVMEEALANVQRHSGSKTASVNFFRDTTAVGLEVSDAGMGFVPLQHGCGPDRGSGVAEMRERMKVIGGRLEILSRESGTTVRAWLPFATPVSPVNGQGVA